MGYKDASNHDASFSGGITYNMAGYGGKGGGIYAATGSKTTINGALALESNSAVPRGNAITQGGAICNIGELTISGAATFTSNTANGDQGSGIAAAASGGAIYNSGTLIISGAVSMSSNSAKTKAGETMYTRGGAIYNSSNLTLSNGTFTNNQVIGEYGQGGAIYQQGTLNMSGAPYMKDDDHSEKINDIYLPSGYKVYVAGSITTHPAGNITPASWPTYGSSVSVLDGPASDLHDYFDKFRASKAGYMLNDSGNLY